MDFPKSCTFRICFVGFSQSQSLSKPIFIIKVKHHHNHISSQQCHVQEEEETLYESQNVLSIQN